MSSPFCAKCYVGILHFDKLMPCKSCNKKFHKQCLGLEPERLNGYLSMNPPGYVLCDECDRHARLDYLEGQVVDLRKHVESIKQQLMFYSVGPLAKEAADRVKRSKNFIVYNFPESFQRDEGRRLDEDRFQIIREILSFCFVDVTNIKVSRLKAAGPGMPRPLKVSLNSEHDVQVILQHRQYSTPGLTFVRDKTTIERNIYRDTKIALAMMQQQGYMNKTIKYISGIPVIVDSFPMQQQDEARALGPASLSFGEDTDDD